MVAPRIASSLCVALLAVFALMAWCGIREKNATYDEVLHAPAAWMHARYHDFRIDPEDPPLWQYWAALPHWISPLRVDTHSTSWETMPQDLMAQWQWCVETLYRTPGNDPDAFINKSRAMMLTAALGLGAVMGWWAWCLGGGLAAVATIFVFTFDPNFLAHAPLVKNDVALSFILLALAFSLWKLGLKVTWWRAGAVAVLCAAAPCVKFSGLIAAPVILLLLLVRSLLPAPWPFFGPPLLQCRAKVKACLRLVIPVAITCFLGLWACYGFRYGATPTPDLRLNTPRLVNLTAVNERLATHPEQPVTRQELNRWTPGLLVRGVVLADRCRLLPEAWLNGLLYTYMTTRIQTSFLCGKYSSVGWWYYFPLAILFKTPIATLLGGVLAFVILLFYRNNAAASGHSFDLWTLTCMAVPFALYGIFALKSDVNLGLRHILPLYPFLFILIGLAASRAWMRWRMKAGLLMALLAAGLVVESVASFPNYLAFFNAAVGGPEGGIRVLGDSNLDWGQDLKTLAHWTRVNPDQKLHLCYFGMADPAYYGLDYVNLPGGYRYGPPAQAPGAEGVIAISATHLQGIHLRPELRRYYAPLQRSRPLAVLGGSIYVYDSQCLTGVHP